MEQPSLTTGERAPAFTLNDLQGAPHSVIDARGRILAINFWSAECPWSERIDRALLPLPTAWGARVVYFAVASNANEPVELLRRVALERGLPVLLLDPGHGVADRYGAVTTPHFFVIDDQGILRYQGAFDDVNFRQRIPTRQYLIPAVQALIDGREPDPDTTSTFGCTLVRFAP
ncbi:MAG: redoxin domain-containing protein [Anaerolineaceae bacterium]|nr:redoxin domain-containing protein [Anaerolineaceae bacterium]